MPPRRPSALQSESVLRPAARMPCAASSSSRSSLSPVTPTAPITSPSASRICMPPPSGKMRSAWSRVRAGIADLRLMRRHRDKERRPALILHPAPDRIVIGAVWLEMHIIAVGPLDDVIIRIAALADEADALEPNVHVAGHQ